MKLLVCSIFFQLIAFWGFSQEYSINLVKYGIEDGLMHRDVRTVFEDDSGFMWIGNVKGLQRFDGHEFKSWNKSSPSGLLYYITFITQDDQGWLWLWNNDKLKFVFLHPITEEILTWEDRFGNGTMTAEKESQLNWIGQVINNSNDEICFGLSEGKIIKYSSKIGFDTVYIKDFKDPVCLRYIDRNNNYWIQNTNGTRLQKMKNQALYKVSEQGEILKVYSLKSKQEVGGFRELGDRIYFRLMNLDNDEIVSKFVWIDLLSSEMRYSNISDQPNLVFATESNLWLLYKNEKFEIYDSKLTNVQFTIDPKDYDQPIINGSLFFYEDSRGMVWFHNGLGLLRFEINKNKFKNHLSFQDNAEKPINNSTRGILVDKDKIYVNCEMEGTYTIDKNNPSQYTKLSSKKWARPMLASGDSNLIIGYPFDVRCIDKHGKEIQRYFSDNVDLFNGSWSCYIDKNEKLWIGAGDKLLFLDQSDHKIYAYRTEDDPYDFEKRKGAIQNIIPYNDHLLWFCSWTGLYLFDINSEKIVARYASDEKDNFLPADLFYYIYEDKEGVFWIGTADGLIRWTGPDKHSNSSYELFTRAQGLSNDIIYAIFEDEYKRLWLSSDYGIMSFHKETHKVNTYLEKDGISHNEFNRTSQFMDTNGRIYFGGLNGITSFHPDDFQSSKNSQTPVLISTYEIFDGDKGALLNLTGELRNTKKITFHPGDRYFRLKFTIPTFEDASKILYAWMVEGVDKDWNYQKENVLQIGMLPYGKHKLRIKGQSGDGGWSPHELQIEVSVLKPFYLQNWFILISILALIVAIVSFFKIRTSVLRKKIAEATITIEKQTEELRKLDKLKSRFFANVSHELRTPLSMMLGPINNLTKEKGLSAKAESLLVFLQRNTLHLKGLVNEILDLSKLESNKVELREKPIQFYDYLRNHLTQFYSYDSSESISFHTEIPDGQQLFILLDDKKFEKIINNYLSNAMKFTAPGGTIILRAEDLGESLIVSVRDSGRGIHPADLAHVFDRFYQSNREDAPTEGGTGIGLSLCKELAELMGGRVWVESELGKGTSFYVEIPKKLSNQLNLSPVPITDQPMLPTVEKHIELESIVDPKPNLENAKRHILIAEDNQDLRAYYQIILSDYNVQTTEHGQAALDYLRSSESMPDLIISDLMMPVMDGMQFIEKLKSSDKYRHIPVIMLTAKSDRSVKLKALRVGIDDYITKPFDDDELLVRMQNMLSRIEGRKLENKTNPKTDRPINISQEEIVWLETFEQFIIKNMDNSLLSVEFLCIEFAMSKSTLQRQIKKMTGLSPAKYIQEHRLNYARELLEHKRYRTIAQVAAKAGFRDPNSFSRSFKQRYGVTPTSFIAE